MFTSKCASHHNGVHFFDISTCKTAPNPSVFNTFYFEMCFAPQPRALFRHLNFQKWSDPEVFCTCSLRNVLPTTTACTFSTSQLAKLHRTPQFLTHVTSKCASRHNPVHFFFQHLNFQKWSDPEVFCTCSLRNVLPTTTACTFSTSQLAKLHRTPQFLTHFTSKCASRHNPVHFFFQHLNFQKWSDPAGFCTCSLRNVLPTTTACTFSTSQLAKLHRTPQFLTHFTSKCASRHNPVHFFFNISTSKSGPILRCFVPFHIEIGFAPQRRATFNLSSPQMSPHPPL